jgi:exonuclease III
MLPGFLSTPSYGYQPPVVVAPTWAPDAYSGSVYASITQALQAIQAELDQLIATYAPTSWTPTPAPVPAPTPVPAPNPAPTPGPKGRTSFTISSFNILSSSAGIPKGYAPGTERIKGVIQLLDQHHVGVVGLQEVKDDQLAAFRRLAGDRYGTFAGASGFKGYRDTTIAWRKDQWDLVKSGSLTVPSYEGVRSQVPYVRLRNKQTGQEAYFIDAHNPANTKRHHHQEGYRDEAARREAALADQLKQQTGLPVFVVGDMNASAPAREIFTRSGTLHAANAKAGIDWIFGSKGVKFAGYQRVRDALVQRTTDHPVVFAQATI